MALISLTEDALKMLLSGETQGNFKPVLQVTGIHLLTNEMFLILLSDGSLTQEGLLCTQQGNDLVLEGKLQKGSIVMLTQFSMYHIPIQKKMIILISDLGVIREKYKLPTETDGNNIPVETITYVPKTIQQIYDEKLGKSEQPDWVRVCGTITFLKVDKFFYTACPIMTADGMCNNIVTKNRDGKWRCDECDVLLDDEECVYCYDLQIGIEDDPDTDRLYATAFEEIGEEIMGISARNLYDMKKQDQSKFSKFVLSRYLRKFVFDLKLEKRNVYDDVWDVISTIIKVEKVNSGTESKYPQLDEIAKFNEEDSGSVCHKIEPAVNYVNTPREFVESATPTGSGGNH